MRTRILKATLAIMAVLLMASGFAIAANAKTFVCNKQVCTGEPHKKDHITGTSLSQTISSGQKKDTVIDTAKGDNDDIRGGKGNDSLDVQEGHFGQNEKDVVDGGPGYDTCYVDSDSRHVSDDVFNCEVIVRGSA